MRHRISTEIETGKKPIATERKIEYKTSSFFVTKYKIKFKLMLQKSARDSLLDPSHIFRSNITIKNIFWHFLRRAQA